MRFRVHTFIPLRQMHSHTRDKRGARVQPRTLPRTLARSDAAAADVADQHQHQNSPPWKLIDHRSYRIYGAALEVEPRTAVSIAHNHTRWSSPLRVELRRGSFLRRLSCDGSRRPRSPGVEGRGSSVSDVGYVAQQRDPHRVRR